MTKRKKLTKRELVLIVGMLLTYTGMVGYLYAYRTVTRFHVIPGYSWVVDGRTGQLCDPWPAKYDTAIKDSEGIPYCYKLK